MTSFLFLLTLFYLAPASLAFEYLVGVGKDENTGHNGVGWYCFDPSSIRPVPGDTITFEFHAGTHSGDVTVPDGTPVEQTGPRQSFQVADSSPLWHVPRLPS
ncbi:hypothetical protein BS47DRAFT_999657 [Hydnum rufescens UP504]|uniref:Uncharacterized protein n=1 Tax=Hydnum rufescens UP504 TaxID=1448309 RepID=A0A9P6B8R2_9AGAM|nr:hypothetical protein BS47DRAFT_999657 [Hydnum rufescens UP504]